MNLRKALAKLRAAKAREWGSPDSPLTAAAQRDLVLAYAKGVQAMIPVDSKELIIQFLAAECLYRRYTADQPDAARTLRALVGLNETAIEEGATRLARFLNLQAGPPREMH